MPRNYDYRDTLIPRMTRLTSEDVMDKLRQIAADGFAISIEDGRLGVRDTRLVHHPEGEIWDEQFFTASTPTGYFVLHEHEVDAGGFNDRATPIWELAIYLKSGGKITIQPDGVNRD